MGIDIKDIRQLEAVNKTLLNCGNKIAEGSDTLAVLQNQLNTVWEDEKGGDFSEVISTLLDLNYEALNRLKKERDALSDYIERLRNADGVEIRQ